MRQTVRILVIAAFAAGAVALSAASSGAGVAQPTNSVTVVKHVTGPVPAGTTFTVEVSCVPHSPGLPEAEAPVPDVTDVTFDATGTPTSESTVTVGAGHQCTVTETQSGTAVAVAYECSIERGETDGGDPPFLGNCTGDNQATFGDVIGDAATITVTNSFATPPIEPITPAAQAVQAAPVFTG
jgi:hypothetical protein